MGNVTLLCLTQQEFEEWNLDVNSNLLPLFKGGRDKFWLLALSGTNVLELLEFQKKDSRIVGNTEVVPVFRLVKDFGFLLKKGHPFLGEGGSEDRLGPAFVWFPTHHIFIKTSIFWSLGWPHSPMYSTLNFVPSHIHLKVSKS